MKEQYIGPNKVETVYSTDHTTPSGGEIVNVVYVDCEEEEMMSRKMFDAVVTEAKSDLTNLREATTIPVAEAILTVMSD